MNRVFIVFSFVMILLTGLHAQKLEPDEISYSVISKQIEKELLKKASKRFEYKEYDILAKNYYTERLRVDPENPTYNYAMALILYSNLQQLQSIPYFERVLKYSTTVPKNKKNNLAANAQSSQSTVYNADTLFALKNEFTEQPAPDTIIEVYYFLANSYHLSGNYDKAKENYKIYLSLLERNPSFLNKTEKEYSKNDINHRIQMCENGKRFSNSSSERSPLLKEGKKIMITDIGSNVNSVYDDFGAVFSVNDSILFFTSRQTDEGNIYFSRFENNKWTKAENIGWAINTRSYESVLTSSPDAKRVYFYRSGIQDGTIYYSDFMDNHWSFPDPLLNKEEVENIFKETTIYSFVLTAAKNELFIITDKKGGMGGKDIYVSEKMSDSTWGALKNLGALVNSPYDEVALSLSPDGNTMYFSSNGNKSIGGFDVFVTNRIDGHWSEPLNLGVPVNTPGDDLFFSFLHNSNRACYSSSAYAGNVNRDLDIYFVDFCDDVQENTIKGLALGASEGTITITDADVIGDTSRYSIRDGKYSINLKVGKRYTFKIETNGIRPVYAVVPVPKLNECKRYDIYQEITFPKPGDTLKIKSAFLDIAFAAKNPDITSYPALLKKEDTGKLLNYCEWSIPTYPAATTSITTVMYDTTSGKVLAKVSFDNTLFDSGKGKIKEIYERELDKVSAEAGKVSDPEKDKTSSARTGKEVTTFSFGNILFDFDKSKIKEIYKPELDKAVEFLKQVKPDSKIEIAGYADSKGHRKHNLDLSKRRAKSVAKYLVSKKINRNRITIFGYGEEKPIAPNKNPDGTDNREGRSKNRRTEVVVK